MGNPRDNLENATMRSLVMRVGIDTGNIGYIGPVSARTNHYVYIPVPSARALTTT